MKDKEKYVSAFVQGYLTCALWSSSDSDDPTGGEHLDENYSVDDIAPASKADHEQQCRVFIDAHLDLLSRLQDRLGYEASTAGHDFWLTRNGHGAGFWDRGFGSFGDALADDARACGSSDPWVDKAGAVHLSM